MAEKRKCRGSAEEVQRECRGIVVVEHTSLSSNLILPVVGVEARKMRLRLRMACALSGRQCGR